MSPIKNNTLYLLYKRGKPEHIQSLFEKGEVYINSIDFIRRCDQNEDRSDVYDGILERSFFGESEIRMCEVEQDINLHGNSFYAINCIMTRSYLKSVNSG